MTKFLSRGSFYYYFLNIYLLILRGRKKREHACEQGLGAEGETQVDSVLSAQSPTQALIPRTHGQIGPQLQPRVRRSTDRVTQAP